MKNTLKNVCRAFGVTTEQVKSQSKLRAITDARKAFCMIEMAKKAHTIQAIGKYINRTHGAVHTANRVGLELYGSTVGFKEKFDDATRTQSIEQWLKDNTRECYVFGEPVVNVDDLKMFLCL